MLLIANSQVLTAKSQEPRAKSTLSTEQEQQFRYYWYAARQAMEEQRYADAYALLRFCEMLNPDDGTTLSYIALMYQGLGQSEQALEYFRQAYLADPDQQWQNYLELLKRKYISEKNWKQAIRTQDEIDKHQEYDATSAITRYRIYAMWDKPKQAIKAIDDYLKVEPGDLRFLVFRLELMEQTGAKVKDLMAMYKRILEIDPYNLMVLNNYAYYLAIHKGDLKEAEKMSAITIRQDPDNPVYLDTYGWIMHLQGQDELAKFYLQKALRNATDKSKAEIQKHLDKIKN